MCFSSPPPAEIPVLVAVKAQPRYPSASPGVCLGCNVTLSGEQRVCLSCEVAGL
jgi:hypothetical protein